MAATDTGGRTPVVTARAGRVAASRAGYLDATSAPGRPGPDTVALRLDLLPSGPRRVEGRVTAGGRVAEGAMLRVLAGGPEVQAGPGGWFAFGDFPPGPRRVEARFEGCPAATIEVFARAGETTRLDFDLRDTADVGAVEGRVFQAVTGQPLPGAVVRLIGSGADTEADGNGNYRFDRVAAGDQRLAVFVDAFVPETTRFRVVKGWSVTVDFGLRREQGEQDEGRRGGGD